AACTNAYTAVSATAICRTNMTMVTAWGTHQGYAVIVQNVDSELPLGQLGVARFAVTEFASVPGYFWVTFLADAFLAGAFLAGAFLAGAFLAGAFLADSAFLGRSMPTSLAARSPTARVCDATVPSASWVSSTAWSTLSRATAEA